MSKNASNSRTYHLEDYRQTENQSATILIFRINSFFSLALVCFPSYPKRKDLQVVSTVYVHMFDRHQCCLQSRNQFCFLK